MVGNLHDFFCSYSCFTLACSADIFGLICRPAGNLQGQRLVRPWIAVWTCAPGIQGTLNQEMAEFSRGLSLSQWHRSGDPVSSRGTLKSEPLQG